MLKSLRIQRFKNLDDITLELALVNVIVGANNSGKSSILQAIQFAVSIAQTAKFQSKTRWNKKEVLSTSLSYQQLIYAPLRDVSALAYRGRLSDKKEEGITIILTEHQTELTTEILVRKGRNRNLFINMEGKGLGERLQLIEHPFSIYVPGLAGIPDIEEYKNPGIVRKAAARGDGNKVFRNVLYLLKQDQDKWEQFIRDLKQIFNLEIDVNFTPEVDEFIDCVVKEGDVSLPIDLAGTGVMQAVQILSYVNVYTPKILILDEPDSHLHPDNQRRLAKMLVKLSEERNLQVVLTTHSRHLMDELSEIAKIHWVKNGKLVEEDNFDDVKVLMEIGALDKGDLLFKGLIKCVLLTEDMDTQPIKILIESSGFKMSEVDIWSYKGCTKVDTAIVLAEFIRRHVPATNILLHRDRDYLNEAEADSFKSEIEKAKINCFLTTGTDAESHFLSPEHIHQLYPRVSVEQVKDILKQITEETQEKSIEKFINNRTPIERKETSSKGKNINHGELARKAREDYGNNPLRYRHGKSVIGSLKSRLQKEIGKNIDLYRVTSFVEDPKLKEIASIIWKNN